MLILNYLTYKRFLIPCFLFLFCLSGALLNVDPAEAKKDFNKTPYTHGNVQLSLETGVTTQGEVLEAFGSPNMTTIDGKRREVWTYQKHATVSYEEKKGRRFLTVFRGTKETVGFDQSNRTMTLIIKFGPDQKVVDFRSMSTSF